MQKQTAVTANLKQLLLFAFVQHHYYYVTSLNGSSVHAKVKSSRGQLLV